MGHRRRGRNKDRRKHHPAPPAPPVVPPNIPPEQGGQGGGPEPSRSDLALDHIAINNAHEWGLAAETMHKIMQRNASVAIGCKSNRTAISATRNVIAMNAQHLAKQADSPPKGNPLDKFTITIKHPNAHPQPVEPERERTGTDAASGADADPGK